MTSSSCVLRAGTKGGPRVSPFCGSDPIACLPASVSPWAFLVQRGLTQAHAPGLGEKTRLGFWEAVRGATPPRHPPKESRSSSAKSCHCHLVWERTEGPCPRSHNQWKAKRSSGPDLASGGAGVWPSRLRRPPKLTVTAVKAGLTQTRRSSCNTRALEADGLNLHRC